MKFCELKLDSLPYFLFKDSSHSSGTSLSFSDSEANWFPTSNFSPECVCVCVCVSCSVMSESL